MTLAAGQGCGSMWIVLRDAGADTRKRNWRGQGMMELARRCSSTVRALTKAAHVPDTYVPTRKKPGALNKMNPSHLARHAALGSWLDEYGWPQWTSSSWEGASWSVAGWQQRHDGSQPRTRPSAASSSTSQWHSRAGSDRAHSSSSRNELNEDRRHSGRGVPFRPHPCYYRSR